jgi:hypothetical protein
MLRSLRIAPFLALLALLLGACALSRESPAAGVVSVESSAALAGIDRSAVARGADAPENEGAARRSRERKLVRSAALRLEVEEYAATREQLDAALARTRGHVARARVEHADGSVAFAALELRVPASAFDGFIREVARLGTVLHEETRTDEISDVYYDAQARLESARQLEHRLLEFASSKTSDVTGLLEVERELGRVREEIEKLVGQIVGYDGQVALSALSLDVVSRQRVSVGEAPALGARLQHALGESFGVLVRAGRGALLALALLLPWLPLFAAVGYLGRRWLRRASDRRRPGAGAAG